MLVSYVEIPVLCFHMKAHLVFHRFLYNESICYISIDCIVSR